MPLSLVLFDGPTPYTSVPLLTTRDPAILEAVWRVLSTRIGGTEQVTETPDGPEIDVQGLPEALRRLTHAKKETSRARLPEARRRSTRAEEEALYGA